MPLTIEGLQQFGQSVLKLDSLPLFVAYLLMITLAGPWQKISKPLSLKPVLIVYNFICSAISAYTLVGFLHGIYTADFIYQRSAFPYLSQVYYWYSLTKKLELMDTVFMVLRHKRRQISVLHIYHHSSMLLLSDYAYHHSPWPAIAPILLLNSFVHVWLYMYYGLTALNPSNPPAWKRRLTELQIVQFYIDMVFAFYGYLYHNFCVYGFMYGFAMIYLFSNFYYHAYVKAKPVNTQNGIKKVQ